MTITTTRLTTGAGVAGVVAGLTFILIQFVHPLENVTAVTTPHWAVVSGLTAAMAVLAIVGITGLYLRQVRRAGLLGLIGYLLFVTCFLFITAWSFVEIVALPSLAEQAPQFVDDFLAVPAGGDIVGDVGAAKVASGVTAVGYLLGGVLFGIALFRARFVPRWSALLLIAASAATVLVPVLPHAFERALAVPMGAALVGLGYSLWSRERAAADPVVTEPGDLRVDAAGGM